MKKKTIRNLITVLLLANISLLKSQNKPEQWNSYIAAYEDGQPGSTTLRMDLISNAPLKNLPYVLITEITYETSRNDGFPEYDTLKTLYEIGNDLQALVAKETPFVLAGSFMYKKERLEYFYIKDTKDLKTKLEAYFKTKNPDLGFQITIKEDKEWTYYRDFLYPNKETLNYMKDQAALKSLQDTGEVPR